MKIAMIASESNPFVKSGGLADVVFSLSKELAHQGEDVSIFLPFYRSIREKYNPRVKRVCSCEVNLSWRKQGANICECKTDLAPGVKFYLVENDYYFNRENTYGYMDDGERFAFFNLLVRKAIQDLNIHFDIIHCHDWQTGMFPVLIKEQNYNDDVFKNTKFVMTIHNEAFLGSLDRFFVHDFYGLDDSIFDNGKLRLNNMLSTLKAGIVYADIVTTVSPTHRDELLSNKENSYGLNEVLKNRAGSFYGILNGIDDDEFNPANDKYIAKTFALNNLTSSKLENKKDLLNRFNLEKTSGPVFGIVSRLTWQKGIDLIIEVAEKIFESGGALIVLGSGEYQLEQSFEKIRRDYYKQVGLFLGYSNEIAHKIYAGCDFFLMPSLFEPCGIGQLIAEKYGTLPIVRNVGGLKDSVNGFHDDNATTANGISFNDYNFDGINYAVQKAFDVYRDKELLKKLRNNAFSVDHSWKTSAELYLNLYKKA